MDVLEYTEEQLRSFSKSDLEKLLYESESKESLYNTKQKVEKTLINGLYGALANKYFPLFNEDIAAAITGNGRYFIRKLAIYIEDELQKLNKKDQSYIISGDTDSVYISIDPFVKLYESKNPNASLTDCINFADSFEKKVIKPIVQKCINDFSSELNAYNKDIIGVEREIIADKSYFLAKKKYFARVWDSEGIRYPEDDPYMKKMGIELIKSSTPLWSKKYLEIAIPQILDKNEEELKNWLKEIKQNYIKASLNEIAAVGGVSRLDYNLMTDKSVPFGSRAAIRHNEYIKKNNLDEKYSPIMPGDKCKRLFLRTPNPFDTEIIAYTNDLFVNEILDYIDYDLNFEKTFMAPLNLMVEALKYDLDKETESLDDW